MQFISGFDINTFSQQNLCSKIPNLDHVLSLVTKTVNFIRGRSLNHRQFRQLLKDLDNELTDVPLYTEVRRLSCHKVLKRFYLLRQEIITFLEMNGRSTDEQKDESWLQDLAFDVDITAHLNNLNLKLQGKNNLIIALYDDVKYFFLKLKLWKSQVSSENLVHFATCKELQNSGETKSALSFANYDTQLESLSKEFEKRFSDFASYERQFVLFPGPFSFDVVEAEENLQMELLEIQSDSSLGSKYLEVGISDFFSYLPERFRNFRKFTTRIMAMFSSTYLCEQLFSLMKSTKNISKNKIDWSTFVIPHQTRHYKEISTTHTRNCQPKKTSSLGAKQWKSFNSCWWISVLNLCIMHFLL